MNRHDHYSSQDLGNTVEPPRATNPYGRRPIEITLIRFSIQSP